MPGTKGDHHSNWRDDCTLFIKRMPLAIVTDLRETLFEQIQKIWTHCLSARKRSVSDNYAERNRLHNDWPDVNALLRGSIER